MQTKPEVFNSKCIVTKCNSGQEEVSFTKVLLPPSKTTTESKEDFFWVILKFGH